MGLIVNKQNPKNVNYDSLKGSGLIHRPDPFCMEESCKPKPNPTPKGPVPRSRIQGKLIPLIATKQGPATNKWKLEGIIYPTFNSLWVNISGRQFIQLKSKQ